MEMKIIVCNSLLYQIQYNKNVIKKKKYNCRNTSNHANGRVLTFTRYSVILKSVSNSTSTNKTSLSICAVVGTWAYITAFINIYTVFIMFEFVTIIASTFVTSFRVDTFLWTNRGYRQLTLINI